VGEQDLHGVCASRTNCREDLRHVAAWIDDGGLSRFVAPQDSAILLKWRDRNDFKLQHG
jgi:hypothetical protein